MLPLTPLWGYVAISVNEAGEELCKHILFFNRTRVHQHWSEAGFGRDFTWYNPGIMSPETTQTKLCPVCGTRLAESATRCVVCGSEFSATPKQKRKIEKAVQPARMPSVTFSLPVALGLLAAFLVVGAGGVYFSLKTDRETNRSDHHPHDHHHSYADADSD